MVSSALGALRNAAQKQADIYNPYITDAASIRQNQNISDGYRLTQLEARVTRATSATQDLLQLCNKAETTIRNKAAALSSAGPASSVEMVAFRYIEMLWENSNSNLGTVCDILVSQGDRAGFATLRALLPALKGTDRDSAGIVTQYEVQLYTRDEKATLGELWEIDGGAMTYLRNNFTTLENFFAGQLRPTAASGMFQRPNMLYGWFGLAPAMASKLGIPWDDLSKQVSIQLVDDFGHLASDSVDYTAPVAY